MTTGAAGAYHDSLKGAAMPATSIVSKSQVAPSITSQEEIATVTRQVEKNAAEVQDTASALAASYFDQMKMQTDPQGFKKFGAGSRVFYSNTQQGEPQSTLKAEVTDTRSTGAAGAYHDSLEGAAMPLSTLQAAAAGLPGASPVPSSEEQAFMEGVMGLVAMEVASLAGAVDGTPAAPGAYLQNALLGAASAGGPNAAFPSTLKPEVTDTVTTG
eukprot:CAMPEP_0194715318 /NCGR_PEP_ID=MMETSP0296-20130528/7038_1 /TAXON_ID=39354 /ORGANISM="Heterosigma akashiwo, Strain CCMP2393" /LENGTH=213 /DNA_ID=CAMNT_0039615089 /DNA_START=38 /DNA_END=676 /DNA_ORIENTATION=-